MYISKSTLIKCSLISIFIFPVSGFSEEASQLQSDHIDELTVNPALELHDVLEKTIARNPNQLLLNAREFMVDAKKTIAQASLPAAPAINVGHQNDVIGSGRGEREWLAELEIPLWLPHQRDSRLKVADTNKLNLTLGRESLKLLVAGLLREALWDIALNENYLALTSNKLTLAKKLQRDVEKRYQSGELAKTDALLAEQETISAEKEQINAEAELMHARNRYYLLTGLKETPLKIEEKQSNIVDYSQSSLWIESASKVDLAESERALAQVESYENPQLLFNIRDTKGPFDNLANQSVGIKVRIPFGRESRAAPIKAAAELALGHAISEREMLRNNLEAIMHEADHNLKVSQQILELNSKQSALAKDSARLAEKSFQLGETNLISLMRVQAQSYEAERAFATSKIQVQWNIAKYNQAVGVLP